MVRSVRQPSRLSTAGTATAVRRRAWVRPVLQFVAAGLLASILLIAGSLWLSKRAATEEAITNARSTTTLLAKSVAEPALPPGLVDLRSVALDRFDRIATSRLLVGDVLRIKIWDKTGQIVYSDMTELIGDRFALGDEELDVVVHGGTDADVSDLTEPENRFEQDFGQLLEVYTQIWSPEGEPLLFEAYYSYDVVSQRSSDVLDAFRPITIAGLLIFAGLTVPLVWALARRLDAAAAERERLLIAAVDASEGERRRIARDLHDGVVQDLAGISYAASATAREVADRPDLARRLDSLGVGVRHSLRALRSLLVEIYPPDLRTEGLAAALDDLVAPAIASGIEVRLHVEGTDGARDATIALIWRVAQESVRNAVRHASPSTVDVAVSSTGDSMLLVVIDDGVGFNAEATPRDGHLGLRALRDLITEAGGILTIESVPGRGTSVSLEVAR